MWTPEAIAAKRGLVQACAYKHWAKWRGTLDRSFLEDLEQEAWVASLAVDPEHPYLAQKLDDALRTASLLATGLSGQKLHDGPAPDLAAGAAGALRDPAGLAGAGADGTGDQHYVAPTASAHLAASDLSHAPRLVGAIVGE